MYRRPTKKRLLIQRIIVLAFMFVSICIIVVATVLSLLGYRIDGLNGRLEQGALVQFESVPTDARVSIDGEYFNTTPTKRTVLAGEHLFQLERDGYRPWSKTTSVQAGTLLWLDYVRLIPETIERTTIADYETVSAMKASPDLQALAIQTASTEPTFELVDIRDRDVRRSTLTIPEDIYTEPSENQTQRFTLDTWDASGRYMLIQHTRGTTREWLVIDTEDVARSVNVSQLLRINLTDVAFAGTNGSSLFGLSDGIIRKLDLGNATISRPLVTNVTSFSVYDSNIISYVGTDTDVRSETLVGLYRDGDREPVVIYRSQTPNAALRIDTSRYFNDRYIAIADQATLRIYRGDFPASEAEVERLTTLATIPADSTITNLEFSPSGNHVVAQAGASFIGYEVEYERAHRGSVNSDEANRDVQWLDGALLWNVEDGIVTVREFDGANVNALMPAVAGFDVTLSQNGTYLYAMTRTDAGFRLERANLILE